MKRGKKIYKSISGMLFGFSLLAVPFSVLANVLETQEASEDTSETLVTFSEDSAFSVVIPKSIQLASNKSADYDIVVKGSIDKSGIVTVLPNDDVADVDGVNFIMENKLRPGMTVSADVIQDDGEWAEREVTYEGTIKSGSITARDLRVGQWEGTLTFNINYDTGAQAHVHSYISSVVKDATCTENGVKQFTCSCGDSYTEDILAAGHSTKIG